MEKSTRLYRFLHFLVRRTFRFAYRRFECVGMEQIPSDGAVIFAPNHTNGLMDALALVWLARKYRKILFVARADIFRKPKIARLLRSFHMLPIMRIRDGYENLAKNDKIMEACVEALQSGAPFCIMPEGTHRAKRSQLPLVKGIFRIALLANERLQGKKIYIVPVGINVGSFFRYRSSMLLKVGAPIDVTTYVQTHSELSMAEQLTDLRNDLTEKLAEVHLTIPDDENFKAVEECCFLNTDRRDSLDERLVRSQTLVQRISTCLREKPAETQAFLSEVADFATLRKKYHVYADAFPYVMSRTKSLFVAALLLLELPYFLVATLFAAPYLIVSEALVRWQTDDAMNNSIRYVASLIFYPLSLLVAGVALFVNFDWWIAVIAFVLLVPSYLFFYDYLRLVRLCYSSLMLSFVRKLRMTWRDIISKLKTRLY